LADEPKSLTPSPIYCQSPPPRPIGESNIPPVAVWVETRGSPPCEETGPDPAKFTPDLSYNRIRSENRCCPRVWHRSSQIHIAKIWRFLFVPARELGVFRSPSRRPPVFTTLLPILVLPRLSRSLPLDALRGLSCLFVGKFVGVAVACEEISPASVIACCNCVSRMMYRSVCVHKVNIVWILHYVWRKYAHSYHLLAGGDGKERKRGNEKERERERENWERKKERGSTWGSRSLVKKKRPCSKSCHSDQTE